VSKSYKKFFDDYKEKMFLILTTKWPWYQPSEQAVIFFLPDLLKIHLHNLFFTLLKILWYHKTKWRWYQPSEQAVWFFLPDLLKIHLHNLFFTLLKILWYHKNCDIWYHTVLTELKTAFNCGKNFI
jgi:hypothetical protein